MQVGDYVVGGTAFYSLTKQCALDLVQIEPHRVTDRGRIVRDRNRSISAGTFCGESPDSDSPGAVAALMRTRSRWEGMSGVIIRANVNFVAVECVSVCQAS